MNINKNNLFIIKLIIIFSTLLAYWTHLAFFNSGSFLDRWIGGCFAFFIALVIANVIRSATFPRGVEEEGSDPPDREETR